MEKTLRSTTASESEKFKATKGKKGNGLGSTTAGSLHLVQATKPVSRGFGKGKYTLDVETVQSKTQFRVGMSFPAAFTPQEAEQRQTTGTNEGRKSSERGRALPHVTGALLTVSGCLAVYLADLSQDQTFL